MKEYSLVDLDNEVDIVIKKITQGLCKENSINYQKQQYRILFSSEDVFLKNNDIRFTSGLKKYLSFYGKVYLNKKGRIIENIHLQNNTITLEPNQNSLLVLSGGINNSTFVENDENLLHFYIAPNSMLGLQDQDLWKSL
jgi:hypothetical protein